VPCMAKAIGLLLVTAVSSFNGRPVRMELWWSSSTGRSFCTRTSDIPRNYHPSLLHLNLFINH